MSLPSYDALVRVSDPARSPVSLAECKEHLRITSSAEDFYIDSLLTAAVAMTDGLGTSGRAIVTQTWRQYVGQSPGTVKLLVGPVQSVSAIGYYDIDGNVQSANLADFDVHGVGSSVTVKPKSGAAWPSTETRPDAIWVEYVAGYGDDSTDVPPAINHAIKMLVAHWYEHRENATEKAQKNVPYGYDELISTERGRWYG